MSEKLTMAETSEFMQALAGGLEQILNPTASKDGKTVGFVLLVFPFSAPEGARTNYISNADRKDVLVALKEIVARFEGQGHEPHKSKQ